MKLKTKIQMAIILIVMSVFLSLDSQAAGNLPVDPPPPSTSNARRIDVNDPVINANIVYEFNRLNDAIEAGIHLSLYSTTKSDLLELLRQANYLLGYQGGYYPPKPEEPLYKTDEIVYLNPYEIRSKWGTDKLYFKKYLAYNLVNVWNGDRQQSMDVDPKVLMKGYLKSPTGYFGGYNPGDEVILNNLRYSKLYNCNYHRALIDEIFPNGLFRLICVDAGSEQIEFSETKYFEKNH